MSASRPSVLIVGGAIERSGTDCVRRARECGLRVIVTGTEAQIAAAPNAVAEADLAVPLDRADVDGHIAWAQEHGAREGVVGAFCFRENAVVTTAAVAKALGVPGNPPDAARLVRHKYRCRERLRAHGFQQPRGRMCGGLDDLVAFTRQVPGPWVVKPVDAHGSTGVTVVYSVDDLPHALTVLPAAARDAFLVEEYQPGTEYSAEGVFVDGAPHVLVLTTKSLISTVVEEALTMPAPLADDVARRVRAVVEGGLRAVGLTYGVFHVEFWIDGDDIVLGEVHSRPAGTIAGTGWWIPMVLSVTGVDMYKAVFEQLVGRRPDLTGKPRAGGATMLFVYAPPGVVQPGLTPDAAVADPACFGVHLGVSPGDRVPVVLRTADIPAGLAATGDSPEGSRANVARLASSLRLVTVPEPEPAAPHK